MRTIEWGGGGSGGGSGTSQEAFETLADWVAALHGGGRLDYALARLTRLVGADAGMAVRHVEAHGRHRQIAVAEPAERQLVPIRTRQSLVRDVLGEDLASFRPGAVWILSEVRRDATFVEDQWLAERLRSLGMCDVAVVILGSKSTQTDYLEFHFRQALTRHDRMRLAEMASALTSAWSGRLPGTVEQLIARRARREETGSGRRGAILDASNPAGLSRSEYRICSLVREGLLAKAIAGELAVCELTVRSHLRSIYAKTGAAGQIDLLHRLTRPAQAADVLAWAAG